MLNRFTYLSSPLCVTSLRHSAAFFIGLKWRQNVFRWFLNLAAQLQTHYTREGLIYSGPLAVPPDHSQDVLESQHVESKCWVSFPSYLLLGLATGALGGKGDCRRSRLEETAAHTLNCSQFPPGTALSNLSLGTCCFPGSYISASNEQSPRARHLVWNCSHLLSC